MFLFFLTRKKTFVTDHHSVLLKKLQYYGVRGCAYECSRDYFTGRSQCVVLIRVCSSFPEINRGVPLGGIVGPFLFILYINDVISSNSNNITMYADDTA